MLSILQSRLPFFSSTNRRTPIPDPEQPSPTEESKARGYNWKLILGTTAGLITFTVGCVYFGPAVMSTITGLLAGAGLIKGSKSTDVVLTADNDVAFANTAPFFLPSVTTMNSPGAVIKTAGSSSSIAVSSSESNLYQPISNAILLSEKYIPVTKQQAVSLPSGNIMFLMKTSNGIYARTIDSSGNPLTASPILISSTYSDFLNLKAATKGSDRIMIAWPQTNYTTATYQEFEVNAAGTSITPISNVIDFIATQGTCLPPPYFAFMDDGGYGMATFYDYNFVFQSFNSQHHARNPNTTLFSPSPSTRYWPTAQMMLLENGPSNTFGTCFYHSIDYNGACTTACVVLNSNGTLAGGIPLQTELCYGVFSDMKPLHTSDSGFIVIGTDMCVGCSGSIYGTIASETGLGKISIDRIDVPWQNYFCSHVHAFNDDKFIIYTSTPNVQRYNEFGSKIGSPYPLTVDAREVQGSASSLLTKNQKLLLYWLDSYQNLTTNPPRYSGLYFQLFETGYGPQYTSSNSYGSSSQDNIPHTTGLSPGAIVGIVSGGIVVGLAIAGGVIIGTVVVTKRKEAADRLTLKPAIQMDSMTTRVISIINTESNKKHIIEAASITTEKLLGRGSFGVVTKGTYTPKPGAEDVSVAVKSINLTPDLDCAKSIEREIEILSKCKNKPYIVPFVGYFIASDHIDICIVMGFMSDGTLDNWLKDIKNTKQEINWQLHLRLALEIVRGIAYLHQTMNIVHRDLKTANVLLDGSKDDPHAKISDFGTSRFVPEETVQQNLTTAVMGTPIYLAPELVEKKRIAADQCSDIYSLALILWSLLTCEVPYDEYFNNLERNQGVSGPGAQMMFFDYIQKPEGRPNISGDLNARFAFFTNIIRQAWDIREHRPTATQIDQALEAAAPEMRDIVPLLPPPSV